MDTCDGLTQDQRIALVMLRCYRAKLGPCWDPEELSRRLLQSMYDLMSLQASLHSALTLCATMCDRGAEWPATVPKPVVPAAGEPGIAHEVAELLVELLKACEVAADGGQA